jgi:taurine dioxygenase
VNAQAPVELEIVKSDAPLGHEIRGIDVANLSDAEFAAVEAAYDRYGVVFMRGQDLTPEQHVAFSKRFGELDRYILDKYNMKSNPEIFVVSNIIENGEPIGLGDAGRYWHSDMWTQEKPPRGSIMYALEVPHDERGKPLGDTMFGSMQAAYAGLPEDLRKAIEGRRAVYSGQKLVDFQVKLKGRELTDAEKAGVEERRRKLPTITHPLVRLHPRTRRKCIYYSEGAVSHIEGMSVEDSAPILAAVRAHVLEPRFHYRHSWRVGDVVMWDNCSCIHKASADFEWPQRRRMHRTTLASPFAPIAA